MSDALVVKNGMDCHMNIQTKILANLLLATNVIKSLFRIVEKAHIGILLGWTSCDNIGFYCFECGKDIEQKNGLQRHNIRYQTLKVENKVELHWLC